MVAVFTGNALGLFNTSLTQTGGGLSEGAGGPDLHGVNAATGNLVLHAVDELLMHRGLTVSANRTYNSRGVASDPNEPGRGVGADGWRTGFESSVLLSGDMNTFGSVLYLYAADGGVVEFRYSGTTNRYDSTAGDGAHDTMIWDGTYWQRNEGTTRRREYFISTGGDPTSARLHQIREVRSDGTDPARFWVIYDSAGRVSEVRATRIGDNDEGNDALFFTYNAAGQIERIYTRENGIEKLQATYYYDSLGRLELAYQDLTVGVSTDNGWSTTPSVNDGRLYQTRYTYDGTSLRIASVTSSDGRTASYTYWTGAGAAIDGRIKTVTRGGETTTFSYDIANRRTTVTDELGRSFLYDYDTFGQILRVYSPTREGTRDVTHYVYDTTVDEYLGTISKGDVLEVRTTRGSQIIARTQYQYDERGNVLWEWDLAGNAIQRTWTGANQLASQTVFTVADPDGSGTASAPSGGLTTRYLYDAQYKLRYQIGPTGEVTEHRYETAQSVGATGLLVETRRYLAAAFSGTATLTALGDFAALQTADVGVTTFAYDLGGRLIERRAYAGYAAGQPVLDAATVVNRYLYDAQGRLLTSATLHGADHPAGGSTAVKSEFVDYVYDGMGRLLDTIRSGGGTNYVRGSDLGQWIHTDDGTNDAGDIRDARTDVTRVRYLDSARTVAVTTDGGATTLEVRDAAGRVLSTSTTAGAEPARNTYHLYDAAGQLKMSQDASGGRTYFFHDERGFVVAEVDPAGALTEYEVDSLGRRTRTLRHEDAVDTAGWTTGTVPSLTLAMPSLVTAQPGLLEDFADADVPDFVDTAYLTQFGNAFAIENGRLRIQRMETGTLTYPRLRSNPPRTLADGMLYRADVTTSAALTGVYFQFLLQNNQAGEAYRRAGIYINGSTIYALTQQGSAASVLTVIGTLSANKRYTFEAFAGERGLEFRAIPAGADAGQAIVFRTDADAATWPAVRLQLTGRVDDAPVTSNPIFVDNIRQQAVRSTSHEYDNAGRLVRSTDGSMTTTHEYDGAGRLVRTTSASPGEPDRVVRHFYDAAGAVLATLDAEGYLTENTYDAFNRLVRSVRYSGATPVAARADGTLTALKVGITGAGDQITRQFFDLLDRHVGTLNAEGYLTQRFHDESGHEVRERAYALRLAPGGSKTLDTLVAEAEASTEAEKWRDVRSAYDHAGRLLFTYNHENVRTNYHYDHAGRLVRTEVAAGTSEVRNGLQWFNAFGELIGELSGTNAVDAANVPRLNQTMTEADKLAVVTALGVRHAYDTGGRRIESIDADGNKTWYLYDAAGRVAFTVRGMAYGTTKNARGEVTETRYDAFGDVASTLAYTGQIAIGGPYDYAKAVAAVNTLKVNTSAVSLRREYFRDARGLLVQSSDAAGGVTVMRYNGFGELVSTTTGSGTTDASTTTRTYDRRGQLLEQIEADGTAIERARRYAYDAFGRVTSAIDGRGVETRSTYDRLGRQLTISRGTYTGVTGATRTETTTATYDAFSQVLTSTDARGHATTYEYSDVARSVVVRTPEGLVTTTERNRHGETFRITAPGGGQTLWTYDASGRVTAVRDPLLKSTTSEYDVRGLLAETTTPGGNRVTYTYDAAGRVLTRTEDADGLALVTKYAYDAAGRQVSTTDANNRKTTTTFDGEGRVLTVVQDDVTGGLRLTTEIVRDALGREVSVTEGLGSPAARETTYAYDAHGRRITETVDPDGLNLVTRYAYDAADNVVARTDAVGNITRFAYDEAGRLVATLTPLSAAGTASPRFGVVRQWYDENGNLTATRRYAAELTLTATEAAALGSETGAGNLAMLETELAAIRDDARDQTDYRVHDRDNRLRFTLQVHGTYAYTQQVAYDARGNASITLAYPKLESFPLSNQAAYLLQGDVAPSVPASFLTNISNALADQATLASGTYRVFDAAGREVWTVTRFSATHGYAVENRYDVEGRLTVRVAHSTPVPWDSAQTAATLDAAVDAEHSTAQQVTSFYYDTLGRLRFTVDDHHYVTEQRYDKLGRPTESWQYMLPATLTTWSLATLEAAVATPATLEGVRTALHAYDAAGRLTRTTDAAGKYEQFGYDAVGNRTTHVDKLGRTTTFEYDDGGRLTKTTDALDAFETFTYDAIGQRRTHTDKLGHVTRFDYDAGGRMTKVTDALGKIESFAYDAIGRRTRYTDRMGASWDYAYDNAGRMIEEKSPPVNVHRYSATSGQALDVDLLQIRTVIAYDAWGNVLSRTENAGTAEQRKTEYAYDLRGNQVRTTFPRAWAIDQTSLVLADTLAATTIEVTFDAFNRAVRQKDVAGNYSHKVYDQLGQVAHDIDAEGYVTSYEYDAAGRTTKLIRRATRLAYNVPAGRNTGATIADSAWTTAIAALPTTGDRTVVTTYDALGRKSVVETTGAPIAYYDRNGNAQTGTPTTKFDYDAEGRVTRERVLVEVIDGVETWADTWHWYDALGRRTHTVDAEKYLTKWTYDDAGRETGRTEFANRVTTSLGFATPPTDPTAGTAATGYDRTVVTGYDALGRKTSETMLRRYQTAAGADASGNVVTTFGYDHEGRNTSVTVDDPTATAPVVTRNSYDALGRLTGVTEHGRSVLKTGWQTLLQTATNTLETLSLYETITPYTRMDYDAFGNVVRIYRPGRGISSGGVVQATADDQVSTTRYDYQGRAVVSIDAAGHATYTNLNARDQATTVIYDLAKGSGGTSRVTELMSYDALGRQLEKYVCRRIDGVDVADGAEAVAYDAFGEIVAKAWIYPDLADTTKVKTLDYTYNAAGQLTDTDESGVNRRYRYNLAGQQVGELRDPAATHMTRMVVDKLGRATTTHLPPYDAAGTITTIVKVYDRWGNVLKETDPRGGITERTYNDRNQVLTQKAPAVDAMLADHSIATGVRPETRWWYDAHGRLIGVRDANGGVDTHAYDAAGQLVRSTDALAHSTRFAYDALGRERVKEDALRYQTTQTYDGMNRVVATGDFLLDATGGARVAKTRETYLLNRNGDRIRVTNALGHAQLADFDGRGLLLRSQSATGAVMEYRYDYSGQKTSETYAAGTALADKQTWVYDLHGRLTDHVDLGGNNYDYAYDAAGLRREEKSTGLLLDRDTTYYANGLVKRIQLSASDYTEYEYDASGNRTREVTYKAGVGTVPTVSVDTRTTYDSHGRIKSVDSYDGGVLRLQVDYVYDALGNRRKVTVTNGFGPAETSEDSWFTYDAENRVLIGDARMDATTNQLKVFNGAPGRRNTAYQNVYDELGRVVHRSTSSLDNELYGDITVYSQRGEELEVLKVSPAEEASGGPGSGGFLLNLYDGTPLLQVQNKYDAAGRLAETVTFFGPYETARIYNWELDNKPIDVRLHGIVKSAIQYTYDADGRLSSQVTWGRKGGTTKAPEVNAQSIYQSTEPQVTWAFEAFGYEGASPGDVHYSWDATNATGLTKLEEVRYSNAGEASGYDAAGRLTTYRFIRHAPAWVRGKTLTAEDWATYTHTYTTSYLARDGYLEDLTSGTSTNTNFKTSTTDSVYDGASRRITLLDTTVIKDAPDLEARRSFVYNAEGQVLLRRSEHKDDGTWVQGKDEDDLSSGYLQNKWTSFYTATQWAGLGETAREALYAKMDNLRGVYVNGQQLASVTEAGTDLDVIGRHTGFQNTGLGAGMTQVAQGDTLKSIAQRIYGTDALWYVLADANGLEEGSELAAGTLLSTPQVKTNTNDATTFKPYDPSEMTGPTSPSLPFIPPPDKGCGAIGQLLMVVVMVVVTIYTAGALTGLAATALGQVGSAMLVGGIASAAGSAASQVVGNITGVMDGFSLKDIAASFVTGALTAGFAKGLQLEKFGSIGKAISGSAWAKGAVTAVVGTGANAIGRKVAGLDSNFSWKSVAASFVSGAITGAVVDKMGFAVSSGAPGDTSGFAGDFANNAVGSVVSLHTRRAFGFDDKVDYASIAIDAFGNALGSKLGTGLLDRSNRENFADSGTRLKVYDALRAEGLSPGEAAQTTKHDGFQRLFDGLDEAEATLLAESLPTTAEGVAKLSAEDQARVSEIYAKAIPGRARVDIGIIQNLISGSALESNIGQHGQSTSQAQSTDVVEVEDQSSNPRYQAGRLMSKAVDFTQSSLQDMVETVGERQTQVGFFALSVAMGGPVKATFSLAFDHVAGEHVESAKQLVERPLSGMISTHLFAARTDEEVAAVKPASDTSAGLGTNILFGIVGFASAWATGSYIAKGVKGYRDRIAASEAKLKLRREQINFGRDNDAIRIRIGHSRPWAEMTPAQQKAFKHSYGRHREELGLPNFKERDAARLQEVFNERVGTIRREGTELYGLREPVNGKMSDVRYFIQEVEGKKFYYSETMDGQFVSAGLFTRSVR